MPNSTSVALDLATLALRLEHLHAGVHAENIARIGAGSPSLFSAQMDAAYAALQSAAANPDALATLPQESTADLRLLAGMSSLTTPPHASADDTLMALTRASSRYQALADGIGRHYSLMAIAIRGAR